MAPAVPRGAGQTMAFIQASRLRDTSLSLSLFLVWKVFSVFTFIIFIANGIIIIWIVDCNNVSCSDF
jgi:hypothetical protein